MEDIVVLCIIKLTAKFTVLPPLKVLVVDLWPILQYFSCLNTIALGAAKQIVSEECFIF